MVRKENPLNRTTPRPTSSRAIRDYRQVANDAAGTVIAHYSTSFSLAVRMLDEPVRTDVRSIYAMVRVADEIVDGAWEALNTSQIERILTDYEQRVADACDLGFSSDLILHAFGLAVRRCGIRRELIAAFFRSMRADLTVAAHDDDSLDAYVYGSAEVVGLMCLHCFVAELPDPQREWDRLSEGARRLGSAFQKVNFLRDLAVDSSHMGRSYFPNVTIDTMTEDNKTHIVSDIDRDLQAAAVTINDLPQSSRRAVRMAHNLFRELNRTIADTPATQLRRRIRVSNPRKALIALRVCSRECPMTSKPLPWKKRTVG